MRQVSERRQVSICRLRKDLVLMYQYCRKGVLELFQIFHYLKIFIFDNSNVYINSHLSMLCRI